MRFLLDGLCAAGHIAAAAVAGTAVVLAAMRDPLCGAWVALGFWSTWYTFRAIRMLCRSGAGRVRRAAAAGMELAGHVLLSVLAQCIVGAWMARRYLRRVVAGPRFFRGAVAAAFVLAFFALLPVSVFATLGGTPSPWETVGVKLCELFFGKLGKALAIVAVVIGGLLYAFGEGGSKSQLAGIAFGCGMVLMAPQFLMWLFGGGGLTCNSAFSGTGTI